MIQAVSTNLRRLLRDQGGLAMIEFAWTMPIVLACGSWGVELANLAMMNLRVSQIALNLADNASRVGTYSTLSTQQLREVDINDVFRAVRKQGDNIGLTTRGRVTLSSLENVKQSYDAAPVQRIHWQRCVGLKGSAAADAAYRTAYGPTTTTAGIDDKQANAGIAKPAALAVEAPTGAGVMVVEINYETKPLFGTMLIRPQRLRYVASFIVRDRRDFSQLFNTVTTPATPRSTCDKYSA